MYLPLISFRVSREICPFIKLLQLLTNIKKMYETRQTSPPNPPLRPRRGGRNTPLPVAGRGQGGRGKGSTVPAITGSLKPDLGIFIVEWARSLHGIPH